MTKRYRRQCCSPGCANALFAYKEDLCFCPECRGRHSDKALKLQYSEGRPIERILIEVTREFVTVSEVADALDIGFDTFYRWLKKYFRIGSFPKFKASFVCHTEDCHSLSVSDLKISKYKFVDKLRKRGVCTCILGREIVMVKIRGEHTRRRVENSLIERRKSEGIKKKVGVRVRKRI